MKERVRAILVTDDNELLTIKRIRPGIPRYWVLPGGHVDPEDTDLEAALHRELREELVAEAEVHALVHVLTADDRADRQYFYLARIHTWRFEDRSGPEFEDQDPGRGMYELDRIPLTVDALEVIDLKPPQAGELIRRAVASDGLFAMTDLRSTPGLNGRTA